MPSPKIIRSPQPPDTILLESHSNFYPAHSHEQSENGADKIIVPTNPINEERAPCTNTPLEDIQITSTPPSLQLEQQNLSSTVEFLPQAPDLESEQTRAQLIKVLEPRISQPNDPAINETNNNIDDMALFLDFISCKPSAPLLHTPPRANPPEPQDAPTEPATSQRKSTHLVAKAKLNTRKDSIQLA